MIKSAKKNIVLIDNYCDDSVLTLFSKIEIKKFDSSHDRFFIIDDKDVYHIGASLKDLGKKWFAFSKFEMDALDILRKIG